MNHYDKFKKTKSSLIFYPDDCYVSGTKPLDEIDRSVKATKLSALKERSNSSYWGSVNQFLSKKAREKLAKQGITTLGGFLSLCIANPKFAVTLPGIRGEDAARINTLAKKIKDICPQILDDNVVSPITLEIVVKDPSPDANKYHQLTDELKEIIKEELADQIRNKISDLVGNVHELKRVRDVQKLEAEINKLESKLAILKMDTNI